MNSSRFQARRGIVAEKLLVIAFVFASSLASLGCKGDKDDDSCEPDDADGVIGGNYAFDLTVDDDAFTPTILKSQNSSDVVLTITNNGQKEHDFVVDCLPTPNDMGCPKQSCFPADAASASIAPGESQELVFKTPRPEGIYVFRSDLPGDTQTGQFIIQ